MQDSIKDEFVARVLELARIRARWATRCKLDTKVGPITTPAQYDKVLDYIEIAKAEGARCLLGGRPATRRRPAAAVSSSSRPSSPMSTTRCGSRARKCSARCCRSSRSTTEEDAVRIANDTIFGLAAGVWTRDLGRAIRVPKQLRAGTVWVNTYRAISFMMPFGGMKCSGVGRESGIDAVREYLETKSVWISTAQDAGRRSGVVPRVVAEARPGVEA